MNRAIPMALAVAMLFTTTGCSKERRDKGKDAVASAPGARGAPAGAARMLEMIPADTPYVAASLAPLPAEFVERAFGPLAAMLDQAIAEAEKQLQSMPDADRDEGARIALAVIGELKGKMSREGLAKLGISSELRYALYGIGLMPAFRLELKDPTAFRATIERIEKKSNAKLPERTAGAQKYWAAEEDGFLFVAAIVGPDLVFGMTPAAAQAEVLPLLFGQKLPATSLAKTNALAKLAADYKFHSSAVGYIDGVRLAAAIIGEGSPVDAAIARAIGVPAMSPACKAELKGLGAHVPRIAFGYEELSAKVAVTGMYVDLRPEVRAALAKLPAIVPGIDVKGAGDPLMGMGGGVDVAKAIDVLKSWAAAVMTSPYQCEHLNGLNEMARELASSLTSPLPPAVTEIKGGWFLLQDLNMGGGMIPDIKGYAILATAAPADLVSMAQIALPPLAQVGLKPDGKPVALPPIPDVPLRDLYVAMRPDALGLSIGAGMDATLAKQLAAKPAGDPPLFAFVYHQGRFARLMRDLGGAMGSGGMDLAIFKAQENMGLTTMTMHVGKSGLVIKATQAMP